MRRLEAAGSHCCRQLPVTLEQQGLVPHHGHPSPQEVGRTRSPTLWCMGKRQGAEVGGTERGREPYEATQ